MAVIKAKPEKVIDFFLATLPRELVLPLIVTRISGDQFKGALGDTVSLRLGDLRAKVREYEWRTRTAPIQFDDIEGGETLDIKLDTHAYSATGLTDEHLTMDDIEFATEVLGPQLTAIAEFYEETGVNALHEANVKHTLTFAADSDPHLVTLEAKRLMDADKVAPRSERTFLVGSDVAAAWLASDRLSKYESTGQEGTPALRNATIGQLANSRVVEVPGFAPNEAYYLHKSGLAIASVTPSNPRGATLSVAKNAGGFGARWLMDYDTNYLRDRSVVSTFLGANDMQDERYVPGDTLPAGKEYGDLKETPKNVRIVKLEMDGGGSVFDYTPTP